MRLLPLIADCGESALLIGFGTDHDLRKRQSILQLAALLQAASLPGLIECVPAVASLSVHYDPLTLPRDTLVAAVVHLCEQNLKEESPTRIWEIPSVYGGAQGADLEEVTRHAGLSKDGVIALHTSQDYHVMMLGFLPGFAYLGDLPEKLVMPRRATPRARVAAGSVAIASAMTAIYPLDSPGGWRIIGHTPVVPWDLQREAEPLFRPGDRVRFKAVGEDEARDIAARAREGWRPAPGGAP